MRSTTRGIRMEAPALPSANAAAGQVLGSSHAKLPTGLLLAYS